MAAFLFSRQRLWLQGSPQLKNPEGKRAEGRRTVSRAGAGVAIVVQCRRRVPFGHLPLGPSRHTPGQCRPDDVSWSLCVGGAHLHTGAPLATRRKKGLESSPGHGSRGSKKGETLGAQAAPRGGHGQGRWCRPPTAPGNSDCGRGGFRSVRSHSLTER